MCVRWPAGGRSASLGRWRGTGSRSGRADWAAALFYRASAYLMAAGVRHVVDVVITSRDSFQVARISLRWLIHIRTRMSAWTAGIVSAVEEIAAGR